MRYRSEGVVLVVGDGSAAVSPAAELSSKCRVVVVAPRASTPEAGMPRGGGSLRIVDAQLTALDGWLGAFHARVDAGDGAADAGRFSPKGDGSFDVVVDLCAEPLLRRSVHPPGYLAAPDPAMVEGAMAAAASLTGSFSKPRYFHYEPGLCAHAAFGQTGCTRCLTVCGAHAISVAGAQIHVEPHLCQGCAACTLACPTGALSFAQPTREALLRAMDEALAATGQRQPVLVVHSPDAGHNLARLEQCAKLSVQPLAAFGEELWLAALARGARRVVLLPGPAVPTESLRLLEERLSIAAALSHAAGREEHAVSLADDDKTLEALLDGPTERLPAPEGQPLVSHQKRAVLTQSLAQIEPADGFEPVTLPDGAPLGRIAIDADRCTLCSTCARLCPTGAIHYTDRKTVRLAFGEASCVQCGMCERGCPENAITLAPRIAPAKTRHEWRLLNEDELAECTACGEPFVPQKLLESIIRRAVHELGVAPTEAEGMRRCPSCRHSKAG